MKKKFKLKNHFGSKRLKLLVITLHDGYFVKPFACIDVYMEPFCYFINDNK